MKLLFAGVILFAVSCTKDNPTPPSTPATGNKPAKEILTSSPWYLQNIRGVVGNQQVYYYRGGSNNLQDFDNDTYSFNVDGSGMYTEDGGQQHPMTWTFPNSDTTKLTISIPAFVPATVNWENITWTDSSMQYDEYYTQYGNNAHNGALRKKNKNF